MGITNGAQVLNSIENLSISDVFEAAGFLAEKWGKRGPQTAIIDCNCVGMRKAHPVSSLISLVSALRNGGFHVILVFDPPTRCHTKAASIHRNGKPESARADAFKARTEIMRISSRLLDDDQPLTAGERATLEAERKAHEKKLKTADKASSKSSLPSDFRQHVEEELKEVVQPTEDDKSILYTTGNFQADSRIQKLVLDGVAQVIIANNADYSFTLGEHCIQVVDYKLDTTSAPSITAITVKSGVYSTLQDIVDHSSKLAGFLLSSLFAMVM